jgi:hypothetical protein
MSSAWYIVLERKIPGFPHFTGGKALARMGDQLEAIAEKEGVRPLMKFFSISAEEYSAIAEPEWPAAPELPPLQWFSAEEGLRTVRALTEAAKTGAFDQRVIDDLVELGKILEIANQHHVRWHLAVDF